MIAQKIEREIVSGVRDVIDLAHDLPGWSQHTLGLIGEEFVVVVEPSRQAEGFVGIDAAFAWDC